MDVGAWPLEAHDKCEANYAIIPFIAEFFSTLTGAFIIAAGVVPLVTSRFSDELLDLVSAFVALNGVFSMLSHATLMRIFGRADTLSINLGSLLYIKCMLLVCCPQLVRRPLHRSILDMIMVTMMILTVSWSSQNVPAAIAEQFDASFVATLPSGILILFGSIALVYGRNSWHIGRAKRVFLRGQASCFVAIAVWMSEEAGLIPCPQAFSMHPIWHVLGAHALISWTALLKYHRGHFYGFRVEIKGRWWCPYTVWHEPDQNPEQHPIIRHSLSRREIQERGAQGRRNSFLEPKLERPPLFKGRSGSIRQLWRGESFYQQNAWQKLRRASLAVSKVRNSSVSMLPRGRLSVMKSSQIHPAGSEISSGWTHTETSSLPDTVVQPISRRSTSVPEHESMTLEDFQRCSDALGSVSLRSSACEHGTLPHLSSVSSALAAGSGPSGSHSRVASFVLPERETSLDNTVLVGCVP